MTSQVGSGGQGPKRHNEHWLNRYEGDSESFNRMRLDKARSNIERWNWDGLV